MRIRYGTLGFTSALALWLGANEAGAAPSLRIQVNQRGDFALIGNTLGHDCATGTPAPIVGTVGECGTTGIGDSAPDVFWRADATAPGTARADRFINVNEARSTAVLTVPAGATITHAFLYWAARRPGTFDPEVTFEREGTFSENVTATESFNVDMFYYQSVADVTPLVQAAGVGPYRVSGVQADNFVNANTSTNFAAWWLVVFYQLASDPPRNLALFDGLDIVDAGDAQNVSISGFLVPNAGFDAKLGVVTFEGDDSIEGDQLFFGPGDPLSDPQNPEDNFFNSTRSRLGSPITVAGDLPQLSGTPRSLSGIDLDVVNVGDRLTSGQTAASISATSTEDVYLLGGFITSISTFIPDFTSSQKTAVDVNGGGLLPGDEIAYTILATNTGNDASIGTVLTDPLPEGVTYVPGSLAITAGANTGPKTDAAGDDQGEYDAATRTLTLRLGAGANGADGGRMEIGETATITFRVTVDATASGTISNQAIINAAGELGAPPSDTVTDGNGGAGGTPPTVVVIDQCATDADCAAPTPHCDVAQTPNVCVECVLDSHCPATAPTCDPATDTCTCIPSGEETCDGVDNNCDGDVDEGCADGDGDGLNDGVEDLIGTDPDDADSDDDGVWDGDEPNAGVDSDGDGLINALDPDSDNDGLFDGTELGSGCDDPATAAGAGNCIADADAGATTTDPLDPDTDDGGVNDGAEDRNLNGVVDSGETDPTAGQGADDADNTDSDGDGLSDLLEGTLGTDPNDADSDDDGVRDGSEPNPAVDSDGDGLINALDPDSDNDGLFDGTELGLGCDDPATDPAADTCIADGDGGATTTSPLDPDTDDGGVSDGSEDANRNGVQDDGETNPTEGNGEDDGSNVDSDGDGLSDPLEEALNTDPNDADSDDDGVRDGNEPNFGADSDGDGQINALDPDSDNDGLFDGTEFGLGCDDPATDAAANSCIADGDGGATTTSPLDPDTDGGGVRDGDEDANHNGVVDEGERDPNDAEDDAETAACAEDSDCGDEDSGSICNEGECVPGCRGEDGNGCPTGQACSSTDATPGTCSAGAGGGGGGDEPAGVYVEGSGILCAARRGDAGDGLGWLAGAALAALLGAQRRRGRGRP